MMNRLDYPRNLNSQPGGFPGSGGGGGVPAGTVIYQGTWDAGTGEYPSTTTSGYAYQVSASGYVGFQLYEVGDWIVYNGSSWSILIGQPEQGVFLCPGTNDYGTLTSLGIANTFDPAGTFGAADPMLYGFVSPNYLVGAAIVPGMQENVVPFLALTSGTVSSLAGGYAYTEGCIYVNDPCNGIIETIPLPGALVQDVSTGYILQCLYDPYINIFWQAVAAATSGYSMAAPQGIVTTSGTVTVDPSISNEADIVLTGPVTIAWAVGNSSVNTPPTLHTKFYIKFSQNSVGGFQVTWPAGVEVPNGGLVSNPELGYIATGANAVTYACLDYLGMNGTTPQYLLTIMGAVA